MNNKASKRNLTAAVGAALAGSLILAGTAQGFENPFSIKQLDSGYMQVAATEGSCGGNKAKEGSCGENKKMKEGSCGESGKAKEGSCGGDKAMKSETKVMEAKCGEAKCGANKR
jgi:uncharacterized low-complexity protein